MQPARSEGTVALDPILQDFSNNGLQSLLQLWKMVAQQQAQIDALGAVVKFSLVNGQTRRFGKRFWKAIAIEEILEVIGNPLGKSFETRLVASQSVNLGQRLHHETGVIVINEITNSIHGVIPGPVSILILQNEIQVSFSGLPVIIIEKKPGSAG